jgi:HKD family nuclease
VSATIVLQNDLRPAEMLAALEDLALPNTTELRLAVAYTTRTGCTQLIPRLRDRIGIDGWSALPKSLLTSFDFGLTEPDALRHLRDDHGFSIRRSSIKGPSFHPKLYAFTTPSGVSLMVGSANLTRAAMTENSEMAAVTALVGDAHAEFERQWHALLGASVPITDQDLDDYAEQRKRLKRPPLPLDPTLKPQPVPASGELLVFPDEVMAGRLDPAQFSSFWIEAGSMSSSASHAQLEMPRYAHRFFGYSFSAYDGDHHVIGEPELESGGRIWNNRKLTWHGNNAMERLNLPTSHQGGFTYPGTAILLTWRETRFRLGVAPWDSDVARAWRSASAKTDNVYRLGARTTRRCGLF